jgi:hypothetical protein
MPKYNVHVFEIVRVKVVGVEADDPIAAAKIATDVYEPQHLFSRLRFEAPIEIVEYSGDLHGYTVDTVGDEETYSKTVHLDASFRKEKFNV